MSGYDQPIRTTRSCSLNLPLLAIPTYKHLEPHANTKNWIIELLLQRSAFIQLKDDMPIGCVTVVDNGKICVIWQMGVIKNTRDWDMPLFWPNSYVILCGLMG
jgi:hypothetical protein